MLETEWGQWHAELEPLDAAMWKSDDFPRSRSGGSGIFTLDRPPRWDDIVHRFDVISRGFVRLRQRIVLPPLNLGYPRWVIDRDFDLSLHLRRVRLPPPGTEEQLLDYVRAEVGNGFDRARAPWTATLVEGLEDGSAALVLRAHHVMMDGGGATQLFGKLFDLEPNPKTEVAEPPVPQEPDISEAGLLRRAVAPSVIGSRLSRLIGTTTQTTRRVLSDPAATANGVRSVAESFSSMREALAADQHSLFAGRSGSSRLAIFDVPLQAFRAGAKAADGSVNDGFLAAVSGGSARYHEKMGAPLDRVALSFAVDVRQPDDPLAGNRFSGAVVSAPVADGDVAERIREIRAQVLEARGGPLMSVVWSIAPLAYRLPAWLVASVGGGNGAQIQTSNLVGSPVPLYLGGARLRGTYAFGPRPGNAMMIVLQSYAGQLCIGVNADAAAVTDFPLFVQCLRAGFDDVVSLAVTR